VAVGAVGVVAAGIGPEHDRGAGMEELAADHDLVAGAADGFARVAIVALGAAEEGGKQKRGAEAAEDAQARCKHVDLLEADWFPVGRVRDGWWGGKRGLGKRRRGEETERRREVT
jgi:hypothetical protein